MTADKRQNGVSQLLVLEDSPTQLRTLVELMRAEGFSVQGCSTASEGLQLLDRERPAVAVVDLRLPDLQESELLDRLSAFAEDVSIIINTGYGSYDSLRESVNIGAFAYVEKAADPDELIHQVHRAVQKRLRFKTDMLERAVSERTRELQATNAALRESERRLTTLLANLPGMAYRCLNLPDWPMQFVSSGCLALTGYTPDQFTTPGRIRYGDLIHPDDRQPVWDAVQQAVRQQAPFQLEYRIRTRTGDEKWVWERGRAVPMDDGSQLVLEGFIGDITERKKAETRIRDEIRFRNRIIERAAEGLCVCHNVAEFPYVRFTTWNDRMTEITGYTMDEINRRGWYQSVYPDPDVRERAVQRMAAMRQGDDLVGEEWELTRKDGQTRIVLISTSVVATEGKTTHVLALMHDITKRQELQQQLLHVQKMEAIGQLAAGIAHDFRNQLTIIQNWGYLLGQQVAGDTRLSHMADEILKAVKRSATLTGQLLSFARKEMLRPAIVDLNQLVRNLATSLERILGEDIRLQFTADCDDCRANVDAAQFEQAIVNMALNARDAMPQGGRLTIGIRCPEWDTVRSTEDGDIAPGRYVAVEIEDTGTGMDSQTQVQMFEPFFTTKKAAQGSGLGLSMVYGFVKQSGGFIQCDSRPGHGTRFTLYFPAADSLTAPTREQRHADTPAGHETILLAEDEDAVRNMLVMGLERLGYTVVSACSAEEALEKLDRHAETIPILVTDVLMPGMNGVELAKRVRTLRPDIAVVYISGYVAGELARRGIECADDPLLTKPFTFRDLGQKLREILT